LVKKRNRKITYDDGKEGGEFSETKASVGYFNILEIIIYN
jgi:hypothetical protein